MDLELRHLRVVVAIAEAGSVTKAAGVLGLAQPALTAQLQRIERTLGGPLFERDRRGARLTTLGELVLDRARILLPAVKGLQEEAARLAGAVTTMRRYRIGAVSGDVIHGGLVRRITADQPEAQVSTYASWHADELADMVAGGRLDYAIVGVCGNAAPSVGDGLAWRVVAMDPVFVLLAEGHPAAGRPEVRLADLADVAWSGAPGDEDGCFGDCFVAACARAGFTPKKIYEADSRGVMDMVEAGYAVGLCRPTFRPVAGLVTRPLAGVPLRWQQLLGWHPDSAAALASDTVVRYAAESYEDSVRRAPAYVEWLRHNPRFGARTETPGRARSMS
jgi:DNA-binding transcriptional LysR family regulator